MEILLIDHSEIIRCKLQNENVNRVLLEFAKQLGVTTTEILEHNKRPYICDVRHLYCKLRNEMHGISLSAAGREIGRTPATVKYGVSRINHMLRLKDRKLIAMWNMVKDMPELFQ